MTYEPLGILLLSGVHDRAHYALVMAAGAAALGRGVTLFAANSGCRALCADWSGLDDVGRDAALRRRGVVGFGELREAAREAGVTFICCETGLRAEDIAPEELWEPVLVAGVATFLEAVGNGQMLSI